MTDFIAAGVLLLGVSLPTLAAAQTVPQTKGLVISVNAAAVSMTTEPLPGSERGFVLGAELGMGMTRHLTPFIGVDIGAVAADPRRLSGHADLGLRTYAPSFGRTVPFLEVAFSAIGTEDSVNRELLGNAFTFGGGVEIFYRSYASVFVGARYTRGKLDEARGDGGGTPEFSPAGVGSTRFSIGIRRRAPP